MKQSFEVVRLKSGEPTLRWIEGGETFHPDIGAQEEARILIVDQLQLETLFSETKGVPLKVWDVGLGGAGNAAAVLGAWQSGAGRDLELVSFDQSTDPLLLARKANRDDAGHFPWLKTFPVDDLLQMGKAVFQEKESRAVWRLCLGDFAQRMREEPDLALSLPDVVIYDFFSPARNYSLWTLEHWLQLRRWLSDKQQTRLVFHSRSTALRVTLLLAGFYVAKGAALGLKEETTLAFTLPTAAPVLLGRDWLEKVTRSTSAEPFAGLEYRAAVISDVWMQQLRRHPQFAGV